METIRPSLYWDDFERRIGETVNHIKYGTPLPIRRVAVFITDICNFRCGYCNSHDNKRALSKEQFERVVERYGHTAIIHITGGEPSVLRWLYPYLHEHCDKVRFNLNTNAYIMPPYKAVKRLKVSLDHYDEHYWDKLVGVKGAFNRVVRNIQEASAHTTVSVTNTLTKENYRDSIAFAQFAQDTFPDVYAVFYSVYKGNNPRFAFTNEDSDFFFENILPDLKQTLRGESQALLNETLDEKRRIIQGVRFPQNTEKKPCYISMSEKVIDPDGRESSCSHLYRDSVFHGSGEKHEQCQYGCNRRLVKFNELVEQQI